MARLQAIDKSINAIINPAREFLFAQKLMKLLDFLNEAENNEQWDNLFKEVCIILEHNMDLFESMVQDYYDIAFDKVKKLTKED